MSLRGQLLWREFFYTVGSTTPNFDVMSGNPLSKQIDWDTNPGYLAAWREGRTGYPWCVCERGGGGVGAGKGGVSVR